MNKDQKGQTLVIMFFIMIIALSIGVMVSNRFIAGLRSSVRTQTRYRAQAVAEAALERILLKTTDELIDYINFGTCGSDCFLQITNEDGQVETATIELSLIGNTSEPFDLELLQDKTEEVNLTGYPSGSNLAVCWDNPTSGNLPGVVGFLVHGVSGNYLVDNFAYNSSGSTITNNFDEALAANGYDSCFNVTAQPDSRALRLKSVYQDLDVMIIPDSGMVIPTQGVLIVSTGQVLDTTAQVSVLKGNNVLPIYFDYALYSKNDTNPLSN